MFSGRITDQRLAHETSGEGGGITNRGFQQSVFNVRVRQPIGSEAIAGRWFYTELLGVLGGAIGMALATAASRLVSHLLYGVQPLDPATFAFTAFVVLATSLAACFPPAHRAGKVDPVEALRTD